MLDAPLRRLVDPALNRVAASLASADIRANALTLFGAAIGLAAAVAISQSSFGLALALVIANRVIDGLDGAVARINGPTEFGGYLDSLADYLFYVSVPVAFGLVSPDNQMAALLLVASFTLTAVSFLAFAAIAARKGADESAHGAKAFIYSTGLMEGGETIAFFILFCVLPVHFPTLALVFSALCIVTVGQRISMAVKTLN
jgi:phosphatidylglycerophosphate synthase